MSTRMSSAVALAALMLLAAALPAMAGGRKGIPAGTTAPRGGVLGGAHVGAPVVRDHRGDNPRGGGVTVTSKPRPRPICAGWAC